MLTKKDAEYTWTEDCQEAFCKLKTHLTEAPVLAFPNFNADFMLETDASGFGLGAVLSQKQPNGQIRPLAYASRTLQKHESNYGISELEALAVVWATKHFRVYLYDHICDVYTDHEALQALLNTPHPSGKLARWGLALQELNLKIHYRPGRKNQNADALSRVPLLSTSDQQNNQPAKVIAALTTTQIPAEDGEGVPLSDRQLKDPTLKSVVQYLQEGVLPVDEGSARKLLAGKSSFVLLDNVLYHQEADKTLRIVVPEADRYTLFKEMHAGRFGGHLRDAKIHSQLNRTYWWPNMRGDITKWSRGCEVCASRNVGKPIRPFLTPIPVGGPFDRLGVDIIKFPTSASGKKYAVVFMDYLTKWPEVFATSDQTSSTIAELLVEHIITRHGVPSELLSDRGTAFLSKLMLEVYKIMGIKKANTTAYHPQTDGLVERFHRTLTDMLAKSVTKGGKDWDRMLPYVLFAYRTSKQGSTGESPFFLLYGRDARLPIEDALTVPVDRRPVSVSDYKSDLQLRLTTAWELARTNINRAQKAQKKLHDKRAKEPPIQVGDRVYVYMPMKKLGKAHKFALPFEGPYRVLALYPNGVDLQSIEKPKSRQIRVALNRVRLCPDEIPGEVEELQIVPPSSDSGRAATDEIPEELEEVQEATLPSENSGRTGANNMMSDGSERSASQDEDRVQESNQYT